MTSPAEIDTILSIIENQVRRRIIKRLSQESAYPLELAKELGIGQQLIAKHLGTMERDGILKSSKEKSPFGPARRKYFLRKSVYLTIGFGPNLYKERTLSFDSLPTELSKDAEKFIGKIGNIRKSSETIDKISLFSNLMEEIDRKLDGIEAEKAVLLYIRNLAMKCACEVMNETDKTSDQKRVLHYLLDKRNRNVENISVALNLRESIIRSILESLEEDLPAVTF